MHGEGYMSCRLFLNRDLLLDLLWSTLEQIAHGLLVTGHCNTCFKSSLFLCQTELTHCTHTRLLELLMLIFLLLLIGERVDLLLLISSLYFDIFGSSTSAPVVVNCVKYSVIASSTVFLVDNTFWTILSEAIVPSQILTRGRSFFHKSFTHNFGRATTLFTWSSSFFILILLNSACWVSCPRCILRPKFCFKAVRKWFIHIHLSLTPFFSVTPDKPPFGPWVSW